MTAILRAYGLAARLAGPFLVRRERRKLAAHGITPDRIAERTGRPRLPRPEGCLIWLHGASVGETLSILPLLQRLRAQAPGTGFLVTCGTAGAAAILASRLPGDVMHQFMPLDTPGNARRFLDHWRPDLAIFVESEIWPVHLTALGKRGIPVALVNARLSEKSLTTWARMPRTAGRLFGHFALIAAQTGRMASALGDLGARRGVMRVGPELKSLGPPPPVDEPALQALRDWAGMRPLWLAASTHPGEDEIVLDAHKALLAVQPEARLVIAPRHPERGGDIARCAIDRGLTVARRATAPAQLPPGDCAVYVADTLGEMGLWYALAPIALIGGSLTQVGGHNPFEAAQLDCAILHGPHVANFVAAYDRLTDADAARAVTDAGGLAATLGSAFAEPGAIAAQCARARATLVSDSAALDDLARDLRQLISPPP